ncbi:MAG: thioredoxin domain-containing protein [Desulfatiglandales bacterium]|jgi:protein-disulfide isomerase|nr:thioredoxin domain-containing protein [Desulfatiglandales bacterium]
MENFNKRMKDPGILAAINRDKSEANGVGVRSTPTIYVNGRSIRNRGLQGSQAIIEKLM